MPTEVPVVTKRRNVGTAEASILAHVLDDTRQMTLYFLDHAKDIDLKKGFHVGSFRTNDIHWLVAHLAWAEHFLILRGVGNHGEKINWLELFRLGIERVDHSMYPSYDEAFEGFQRIHKLSLDLINGLSDDMLTENNELGLKFIIGENKRAIIHHCIRHEGYHCGQIGLLLRMHGKKYYENHPVMRSAYMGTPSYRIYQ